MIDQSNLTRALSSARVIGLACLMLAIAAHTTNAQETDAKASPTKTISGAGAEGELDEDGGWLDWFFPIGDRKKVKGLEDEYVPFLTEKDQVNSVEEVLHGKDYVSEDGRETPNPAKAPNLLPARPSLLVEVGDRFLDTGQLDGGFEVPLLGAVWQPRFWAYAINRTTVQSFKDGASGNPRETEIANRLDLFANLQLTGTEKILLGLRPTDQNRPDRFTRYSFEGQNKGENLEFNLDIETFFFEGDFGSLFPNLDKAGILPIDYGFTVGRQPLVFQEGILINDTIDAVGVIRNNLVFPGTSNFRVSAMWGWNRLDRNDFDEERDENMYGVFIAADTHTSTFNLDTIYVDDSGDRDAVYLGASAIQRIPSLGGISTAFRVNASYALEEEVQGAVGTGVLLTSELSKTVYGSDDIVYFNTFLGVGNFTQAGREAVVGGPLANTGILFASPNLSLYGAEINPFTGDDVVGGALGYQAFWDGGRRNLILELAGRHDLGGDDFDSVGVGFQLQQAVGQHVQLQFEGFYTLNEGRDDSSGLRAEVQVVY